MRRFFHQPVPPFGKLGAGSLKVLGRRLSTLLRASFGGRCIGLATWLVGFLFLACASVFAGTVTYVKPITNANLSPGTMVTLSDPTWVDEMNNPGDFVVRRENQVRLIYSRDSLTDVDGADWQMTIAYTIFFTGQPQLTPVSGSLSLAHTSSLHKYTAAQVFSPGSHTVRVRINTVTVSGTTSPPEDIHMEVLTVTERYRKLDVAQQPDLNFEPTTGILSWNYVPGAEEYDLEWAWVDSASGLDSSGIFKRAVRVNMPGQYYLPQLNYRAGVVWFRVRAVGRFIDMGNDHTYRRFGAWSDAESWEIEDGDVFERDRNLTWTTSFAEDGKFKKVVTYVDGVGKTRQSVTQLSSDSTSVVVQTEYDHEGRGVLTTIPIPVSGIDLRYRDLLNTTSGGASAYDPDDFDDLFVTNAMAVDSGAANYFSSSNTLGGLHRDYIPDAHGFPFTETEFMRDATGRVARQGGVGEDHRLGSGHETRFFYADASATQLHRMFGGNVGKASHYMMKMSVDPNGQLALAWQDQEQRVVATALAGDTPGNLLSLDDLPTDTITENLYTNNEIDTLLGVSHTQHIFPNETPGKLYSFYYAFTGPNVTLDCICKECAYTLEISIRGPDGRLVDLDSASGGPTDTILTATYPEVGEGCPNPFHAAEISFSANFDEIGAYRVEKNLRSIPVDLQALRDSLEGCGPSLQDILDEYISGVDTTVCNVDCYSLVPIWVSPDTLPAHIIGMDTLDSLCNGAFYVTGADIAQIECGSIYQQMWQAYAPGGWLHDSLVWAGLGGDSTRIDSLIRTHREWCHYTQCIADTGSRVFDIVMASLPTFSKAVQYNYYPSPFDSLVDPWFNNTYGSGRDFRGLFLDSLLDDVGHPFQDDPDSAIIAHFSPDNSDLDPSYFSTCAGDPDCEDTLRHFYTRAAYFEAKLGFQIRLMEDSLGCPYYQDVHTIVYKPQLPSLAMEDIGGYNSFLLAGECNYACAANVAIWVAELTDSCTALSTADSLALVDALFAYCLGTCQDGNPQALLTEENIASGALSGVIAILDDHSPCEDFLDSIAVPDPYIYTDGVGDTLKTLCTFWDPCFTALVDVINENWAYGAYPGQIAIANYPVLQWCYPGDSLIVVTDTSVVLVDTNNAMSCQVLYLVDENGMTLPMDEVKFLRVPVLNVNPVGLNQSFVLGSETFDYQHIELEVTLLTADSTDSLVQGFVYSSCDSFLVWQDSCLSPQIPLDSAWLLVDNPQAVHDSCVANLLAIATHNATIHYYNQHNAFVDDLLQTFSRSCFESPFTETFQVRHLPMYYQYTLYYYDQAGTLVQTVPPEGVDLLDADAANRWVDGFANPAVDTNAHRLSTRYTYNTLQQTRSAVTPDKGLTRIWYNSKDQVRLSRDARQVAGNDYGYVRYDELGRTVESGQVEGYGGSITQAVLDDFAFPERSVETLTDIVSTTFDTATGLNLSVAMNANLRTRVSAVVREDAEGDTVAVSLYGYDDHGNVARTRTDLRGLGVQNIDYDYELVSGKVRELRYQDGFKDYFGHRYSYDADNRLTKVRTSRDKLFWDLDGRYHYYKHGPLARLEVGEDHVQGQDHYYSIHGWIKGVNMPGDFSGMSEPGHDGDTTGGANLNRWAGRDAYSYALGFYDGDYNPIGTVPMGSTAAAWTDLDDDLLSLPGQGAGLYNGNIAWMITDLNFPSGVSSYSGSDYNAMAYQYDQLNRIKQSRSYIRDFMGWSRLPDDFGYYDTDYGYDRNGNILYMHRYLPYWTGTDWEAWEMDVQEYHYNRDVAGHLLDNKLKVVRDGVSGTLLDMDIDDQAGGFGNPDVYNYRYDAIGNLVRDSSEHIDTILWDLQGKVRAVIRDAAGQDSLLPDLYFWYDGLGRRIRKQVLQPTEDADPDTTDTWYALDPQGNVMAVYEQTRAAGWKHTRVREFPIYGADRLGMVTADLLLRSEPTSLGPVFDPAWSNRALMIGEIMYDSPKERPAADPDSELSEGEFVVLVNNTDRRLPLSYFSLVELLAGDTVVLDSADTLEPQQRMVLGWTDSLEFLGRLAMLPADMREDTRFSLLRSQMDMALPDKGGIVAVLYQEPGGDTLEVDRVAYGEYFGLAAENDEIADSLVDSLEMRDGLMSVLRTGYTMGTGLDGAFGAVVGQSDPPAEPLPLPVPAVGSYLLSRGAKRYEFKNHLGDVLAVVSDLKLGTETGTPDGIVEYYAGDVARMQDYYPFGMEMPKRGYVAEEYRYGYNGKEKDNEVKGSGNSYSFGARVYDSRLGRWETVDPAEDYYPSSSPYCSFGGNPIYFVDPGGESLRVSGIIQEAYLDMESFLTVDTRGMIELTSENDVVWAGIVPDDLKVELAKQNAGFALIASMIDSKETYEHGVQNPGEVVPTIEYHSDTKQSFNTYPEEMIEPGQKSFQRSFLHYNVGTSDRNVPRNTTKRPPAGVACLMVTGPHSMSYRGTTSMLRQSFDGRISLIFHEMCEGFLQVEGLNNMLRAHLPEDCLMYETDENGIPIPKNDLIEFGPPPNRDFVRIQYGAHTLSGNIEGGVGECGSGMGAGFIMTTGANKRRGAFPENRDE
jgi:RHS repeat-associated protein